MRINFHKYQGTGNDFIIISDDIEISKSNISRLCNRRFGIGADGLMIFKSSNSCDFEMVYFNADGNESTFCGNGARSIVKYGLDLGLIKGVELEFIFRGNIFSASVLRDGISIKMQDVLSFSEIEDDYVLNTGSPHYVSFKDNVKDHELTKYAKNIRYSDNFTEGINVNIVEKVSDNQIFVRTYERGVEEETYSCGTGVVAAAITYGITKDTNRVLVNTLGGNLEVRFVKKDNQFRDIYLIGPAEFVFKGEIDI